MVKKRKVKKNSDLKIEVKNLDKAIKASKDKCDCGSKNGSGFYLFGAALAMVMSFDRAGSILWAILHGIFSWFYVLYRAMQIWGWF